MRYVDDFALFSGEKGELWAWKDAIIERLARFRLVIHETRAQALPVDAGIPWLGFVVYPTHRMVKARKVRTAHRRLRARLAAYHAGEISFAELDAGIQGWINHVAHADSWGCAGISSTACRSVPPNTAGRSRRASPGTPEKKRQGGADAPLAPHARRSSDQCSKMGDEHNTRKPMLPRREYGTTPSRSAERASS